ncbi:hypothetical protein DID73_01755 [Candidatus Marinamargulisbacteria bacterium SCGC AG-343-K17]|nr:hypothetical protein DID73_01755 [Candidatus Marinamargulisbacteria bacterium SCGC AG-343-K17]
MKKLIKLILILSILFIPIWVLLDNFIIKKAIISTIQKATKKETHLNNVTIQYFPLSIELMGFKCPNPIQNNYLITAESLKIDIDTLALLKKSLIINAITSNKAILLDNTNPPLRIMTDSTETTEKKPKESSNVFKNTLKKSLSMFDESEIKSNVEQTFDFSNETNEVNEVIENSRKLINTKKGAILEKTTSALYQISGINIDNITSLDQLNQTQKTVQQITEEYNKISNDIKEVEGIYRQSETKITEINNDIGNKINDAFTFEVIKDELTPSGSVLSEPSKKIIELIIGNLKKKTTKKETSKIVGKTYEFNTKKQPRFLLKRIEINTFDDNHYLKGLNITTSKIVTDELKLYMKLMNQPGFEKFIINISSEDKEEYSINSRIRNIRLKQTKLYENEDIIVNFLENKQTNIDIKGTLATSSNMLAEANIAQPTYRVISKNTNHHILSDFIPYLNNEDLNFSMKVTGEMDNLNVNVDTNLDPLMNNIQTTLLDKKIKGIKEKKQKEIDRIKKVELEKNNQKALAFTKDYEKTIKQLKFQENEILNQKEVIERRVNQKKVYIENSAKNELKGAIKKIKLN